MLRLKQALGSCMLASALLPTVEGCQHYFAVAHAATYYVDTAGSDSHPGTEKQPWRTVAYAVSKMVAGDTTYVRGGTYNEGLIRFSRTGTQAAPIKLLNYPGESPIINFIDPKQFPRILIQHASRINVAMGWITIEGFEIAHGYDGIKYYNLHDSTIRRNWIHHSLNQGILGGGGHHNTFDRNIINHNGGTFDACAATGANLDCNQRHGFYLHGNFYTIINNLIYDNLAFGIQVNGSSTSAYSSTKHPGPEFAGASDWVISNNVFAYQYAATGIVLWGGLVNRVRIENNIFYENNTNGGSSQGIFFTGLGGTGNTIRNNLAYATTPRPTAFLGPTGATEGVNYTQSGNVVNTDNPRFLNAPATLPESPNFKLHERSPAIDKGLSLNTTRISFDGTTRPQGRAYDIGAYEYSVGGDTQSPATPIGLQAH